VPKFKLTKTLNKVTDWLVSNPATVFLVFATIFGLILCFRMQPLNGTDEFTHFPRAYQIESGHPFEQKLPYNQYGGYLPVNIANMISDYRDLSRKGTVQEYNLRSTQLHGIYSKEKSVGSKTEATNFTSDSAYPPWSYFPSVIGIYTAKAAHAPLIWYVYLSRIFSLVIWVILVYLAVKVIPAGKWFIVALALLPTSITQALTVGLDSLLLGSSWLLIALVFAFISKKIKLSWAFIVVLTVLSLAVSSVKQGYILLAALPLLIPQGRFYNKRYFTIWKVALATLLIATTISFGFFTSDITKDVTLTPVAGSNINSGQQLHYILHNPFLVTGRFIVQPFTKSYDTVYEGVVGILTNRLIYLSIPVMGLLYLALLLSWKQTKALAEFIKRKSYFIIMVSLIAIGTYLLISAALFLSFTQVGSSSVSGIGGRYFLPILPLSLIVPLSIDGLGGSRLTRTSMGLIVAAIFIGLISTVFSIS
jgi:uncharacterized membrane protein